MAQPSSRFRGRPRLGAVAARDVLAVASAVAFAPADPPDGSPRPRSSEAVVGNIRRTKVAAPGQPLAAAADAAAAGTLLSAPYNAASDVAAAGTLLPTPYEAALHGWLTHIKYGSTTTGAHIKVITINI